VLSRGCCSRAGAGRPVCWLLWKPQDIGDPLATSLVAFERQNSLTVFSADGAGGVER
jgi:hypothetical protein